MSKKLTAASVARYRAGSKRRMIPDGRGLYLIVQPGTGSKSWAMFFRGSGGRMVKLTLGPCDDSGHEAAAEPVIGAPLSLVGARRLAAEVHRQRVLGEDVVAQRLRDKAERKAAAANTFAAAARDFISDHSMQKVRGWREQARLLGLDAELNEIRGGLCERWRGRPISSIDDHDIHRLIDEVRRRGVPGLGRHNDGMSEARARHMYSCLSRLFSWLCSERRVESNPCVGVHRPETPKARERVLSDGEIVKFWAATDRLGPPFGAVLKLLLLTGQRLNEIAGLCWEDVSEDGTAINLPGSRTKNHRAHTAPLSKAARAILTKVGHVPESPLVFTTTGTTPVSGWSKTKRRLDALMGVTDWRIHDLRRTAASNMARAGADLPVIERALNHVSGSFAGIVSVYQKHQYADEVRAAMDAWANLLAKIVESGR
jgi:integrase